MARTGIQRRSGAWISTLASTILGIVVGAVSDTVFDGSPAENLANGLLGAALGLILGILLENTRLNDEMEKVSEILQDPNIDDLVKKVHQAKDYIHKIDKTLATRAFFEERLLELRNLTELTALARGEMTITPDRELTFNREALSICRDHLRAVSYQDEDFWKLPEGIAFLGAMSHLLKTGREITRIFIFDHPIRDQDVKQMTGQQTLGVHVRVLAPTAVAERDRLDFVLYDKSAVRVAESSTTYGLKSAKLHVAREEVQKYVQRFENLRERSVELTEFLQNMNTTAPERSH